MRNLLLIFSLTVFAAACTQADDAKVEPNQPAAPAGQAEQQPAGANTAMAVYDVKCGCSIDGIGRCGNYVMIDGKYVPLIHPSLGKMEFCAQKDAGAKIEASGAMADGKFVAKSWQLVE